MSQEVIKRPPVKEPEQKKKLERPKKYKVVMYEKGPFGTQCHICVLTKAFNMSVGKAIDHMYEAGRNGKSIVLDGLPRDTAETKADDANNLKDRKALTCNIAVGSLDFTAEPEQP